MDLDTRGTITSLDQLFYDDIVILDFGPFSNQRLYYTQQEANTVLFSAPREGVPPEYVGLINQKLWKRYGVALGGALVPDNAYTAANITGLIGP